MKIALSHLLLKSWRRDAVVLSCKAAPFFRVYANIAVLTINVQRIVTMLRMIPSFDLSFSLMAVPIKTCKTLEAILLHSFLCDEIRNNQIGATNDRERANLR